MSLRASLAFPLLVLACATSSLPDSRQSMRRSPRLANLQRAAALPWRDEGRCVVREAARPWPVVVEMPHRGGHELHNRCADRIPDNSFSGGDVLVRGKRFDALQLRTRTLWEVKTNVIATYNPFVLRTEMEKQVEEAQRERGLAASCGFHFRIGVHSEAHKAELERLDDTLDIVVMDWC